MTEVLRVGHPGGLCNRLDVITTAYLLTDQLELAPPDVAWPLNEHMPARFDDLFEGLPRGRLVSGDWDAAASDAYDAMRDRLPANYRSEAVYHDHLVRLLDCVVPAIRDEADRAAAAMGGVGQAIGVHIRRAEVGAPISPFAQPLRYYEALMRAFPAGTRFFVATDSAQAFRWLSARFGNRVFQIDRRRHDRSSVAGVQESLVDLLVLSRCQAIIGTARSSFSHIAALLGRRPVLFVQPNVSVPDGWPAFSRTRWLWAQRHFLIEPTFWTRLAYYELRPAIRRRLRGG
jgi:hypothetical protein